MKITQQALSEIVGRSRESVNKQLHTWKKRGWIETQWGALTILKPDKLAETAADGIEFDPS